MSKVEKSIRGPFAGADWQRDYAKAAGIPHDRKGGTYYPVKGVGRGTDAGGDTGTIGYADLLTPRCVHDAARPAIVLTDGRKLYGAQGTRLSVSPLDHLDLVIDCAGAFLPKTDRKFVRTGTQRKLLDLRKWMGPDVLRLDWPDMTAPTQVGIRFWRKLLALLPQHTAVCCIGGHGRTGTALASLLIASGLDGQTAIDRVRTLYCAKAIENAAQEAYLLALAATAQRTRQV